MKKYINIKTATVLAVASIAMLGCKPINQTFSVTDDGPYWTIQRGNKTYRLIEVQNPNPIDFNPTNLVNFLIVPIAGK